jgi:Flp pilus assembly protein TadD
MPISQVALEDTNGFDRAGRSSISKLSSLVNRSYRAHETTLLSRLKLCFLFLLASPVIVPVNVQAARDLLQSAQQAYANGDSSRAIADLQNYLKFQPRDFQANEMMGLILASQGKASAARSFFISAVEAQPDSASARSNLAADLAKLNMIDAAESEFQKALTLDPDNPELNHNIGEFCAAHGKMKEAVVHLQRAQRLRPTYNNGYDLALAEMEVGMLDASEASLRALLQQNQDAELHSLLGTVLEKKHQYIAAANEMQLAAEMDPSEENLFNWGAELLRHQTLEPAVEVFHKGAERYPQSWRLLAGLGVSQYLLGNKEDAVTAFCVSIDLDPKDPRPYFFLSKIHGISESQSEAVSHRFEAYVNDSPGNAKARFYYAMNLWDSDTEQTDSPNMQKAKKLLQESIALDPKYADAHLHLGILYSQNSNDKAALIEFERAVALDPSLNVARYRLARTLIKLGRREEGQKELAKWNNVDVEDEKQSERRQEVVQFLYNPSKQ